MSGLAVDVHVHADGVLHHTIASTAARCCVSATLRFSA